jgi:hypothetical protein
VADLVALQERVLAGAGVDLSKLMP